MSNPTPTTPPREAGASDKPGSVQPAGSAAFGSYWSGGVHFMECLRCGRVGRIFTRKARRAFRRRHNDCPPNDKLTRDAGEKDL